MPANKKSSKRSRAKKPASKKPSVKTVPVVSSEPATTAAPKAKYDRGLWGLVVLAVLVAFFAFVIIRRTNTATQKSTSETTDSSQSTLQVVPGQDGGSSSNQASDALQPQPAGLQQAQSAQSAGGSALQAQSTTDINR